MKKLLFALFAVLFSMSALAASFDKKSDKVILTYNDSIKRERDCKISQKEIENYVGGQAGLRYICIDLVPSKLSEHGSSQEMVPNELAKLAELQDGGNKNFEVKYTGRSAENVVATFTAWIEFLVDVRGVREAADWTVAAAGKDNESGVEKIEFTNSQTGQMFTLYVEMGVEAKY